MLEYVIIKGDFYMKIKVNYDLIDKIKQSQKGITLSKTASKNFKYGIYMFSIYTILDSILYSILDLMLSENKDSNVLLAASIGASVFYLLKSLADEMMNKCLKEKQKQDALIDLIFLTRKLKKINIDTSPELLIDSKIQSVEYKINLNEEKIPNLLQNKYILIPTYNDGEIKEKYVLQEHVIGSKEYTLSSGYPQKVLKLAHNLN